MTHLVAQPGDRLSLCGVKKPLPVVWAPFADAHVDGYGMTVCPDCLALIGRLSTPGKADMGKPA